MKKEIEEREREQRIGRRVGVETIRTDLLETFAYAYPKNPVEICTTTGEFSCVCPMTGLPDYGTLAITYVPQRLVVELKSLKYYLLQYREVGIFYEHLVNRIGEDLVAVLAPRRLQVEGRFTSRGGLSTVARWCWPVVD